jgi:hypothetical protein
MFSRKLLLDVAERAAWTWVETFAGLLMVSGITDWDAVTTAMVAAIPAALAVVKGGLASFTGDRESAAFGKE